MISIIIPIYNVEGYLRKCTDSILSQTFTDFEIILVDDGSTDSSGIICDDLAKTDSRFSVIHQSNKGVSEARNNGLQHAKGDFIIFIDGDDVIHASMLQVLHDAINSDNYDFSMVGCIQVPHDYSDSILNKELKPVTPIVMSRGDCIRELFGFGERKTQFQIVCNKLYRKELLDSIFFRKTGSEDTEFNNRVYLKTSKAIVVNHDMYYWVQRQSSITHAGFNQRAVDCINSYKLCLDEIPVSEKAYRSVCLKALYKVILHTRYNARNTTLYEDTCKLSEAIYNETRHEFIHSELPLTYKLGLMGLYHIPSLYSMMISAIGLIKK